MDAAWPRESLPGGHGAGAMCQKGLFLLSHQMELSFYFITWDIFKYKHIQNNSEWSLFLRLEPLMWQCVHSAVSGKIFRFWGYGLDPEGSTSVHAASGDQLRLVGHSTSSLARSLQHSRHSREISE